MSASSLHSEQVTDLRIDVRCGETSAYRAASGQTLIELAAVFAFLGAIAALGLIAASQLFLCRPSNGERVRRFDLPALQEGLQAYRAQTGAYPQAGEGLEALVDAKLIQRSPRDPWHNPYRYALDGEQAVITSMGPDGLPGTEDDLSSNDSP